MWEKIWYTFCGIIGRVKIMKKHGKGKPGIRPVNYHCIVIDIDKYNHWFQSRKRNYPQLTHKEVAERCGYGRSLLSHLLHQDKYDIEPGNRFIATFLHAYGLQFEEIFRIVRTDDWNTSPNLKEHIKSRNKRRYDEDVYPHTANSF